jgi:UDP-2,3-diacylglucosamine pyrophosphatase LpxH
MAESGDKRPIEAEAQDKAAKLVVISDLHMSEGWNSDRKLAKREDFLFDDAFVRFLEYLYPPMKVDYFGGARPPVHLVINGDFLDFMPVRVSVEDRIRLEKQRHGRHGPPPTVAHSLVRRLQLRWWRWCVVKFGSNGSTDEPMGICKLDKVAKGHARVFEALRRFLEGSKNRLTVVVGNHDVELCFSGVQERFRELVTAAGRDPAQPRSLDNGQPAVPVSTDGGVSQAESLKASIGFESAILLPKYRAFIEHGNQHERFTSCPKWPPVSRGDEKPFSLPFGSYTAHLLMNPIEDIDPHVDNIKPSTDYLSWAWGQTKSNPLRIVRVLGILLWFLGVSVVVCVVGTVVSLLSRLRPDTSGAALAADGSTGFEAKLRQIRQGDRRPLPSHLFAPVSATVLFVVLALLLISSAFQALKPDVTLGTVVAAFKEVSPRLADEIERRRKSIEAETGTTVKLIDGAEPSAGIIPGMRLADVQGKLAAAQLGGEALDEANWGAVAEGIEYIERKTGKAAVLVHKSVRDLEKRTRSNVVWMSLTDARISAGIPGGQTAADLETKFGLGDPGVVDLAAIQNASPGTVVVLVPRTWYLAALMWADQKIQSLTMPLLGMLAIAIVALVAALVFRGIDNDSASAAQRGVDIFRDKKIGGEALDVRYVVFGHSHEPGIKRLDGSEKPAHPRAYYYNTGAWTSIYDQKDLWLGHRKACGFLEFDGHGSEPRLQRWNDDRGAAEPMPIVES